jgi:MerR family copper efflux transcriptional regulator
MRIGELSKATGVSAKTIRYYEDVGLLIAPPRRDNNYRDYGDNDVATLNFIHRARNLGFAIKDVAQLVALWRDKDRASADVKAFATRHIAEVEVRIAELQSIRDTLATLAARCHGDDRPDCPILDDLQDPMAG